MHSYEALIAFLWQMKYTDGGELPYPAGAPHPVAWCSQSCGARLIVVRHLFVQNWDAPLQTFHFSH